MISEHFSIPVYTLVLSFVSCACILWIDRRAHSPTALSLTAVIFISGFFSARLFHILYEDRIYYWQQPDQIFAIWRGGFVWYGGVLGAMIAALIWCRTRHESFLKWADFFAPVIAIGYGVGRLACFFNGCCYGRYCETPWGAYRHPTQLYMFVYEIAVGLWLLKREKAQSETERKHPGYLFFLWLGLHGFGRFWIELLRDDPRGPDLGPASVSALLSLLFMGVAIVRVYFLPAEKKEPFA